MASNILVVDDSTAIRKIIIRTLSQTGMPLGALLEAGDGAEALAQLQSNSVHLIFSDINMPNMDGLQFLGELKRTDKLKHIPVVMISTEGSNAKVLEAVSLGAAGYIRKPFTADHIKEKVSQLLEAAQ